MTDHPIFSKFRGYHGPKPRDGVVDWIGMRHLHWSLFLDAWQARKAVAGSENDPDCGAWILTGVRDPLDLIVASFFEDVDTYCPGLSFDERNIEEELGRVTAAFRTWTAINTKENVGEHGLPADTSACSDVSWRDDGAMIRTPLKAWSFALSAPVVWPKSLGALAGRVRLTATEVTGRLGVGLLDRSAKTWIGREFVDGDADVVLRFPAGQGPMDLVVGNASTVGVRSSGVISGATVELEIDRARHASRIDLAAGAVHKPVDWITAIDSTTDGCLFWFEREFRPFTEIDIFEHPIDEKPFITFKSGRYNVLLYRFEKLKSSLPDMFRAMGLVPPPSLADAAVGFERRSDALRRAFKASFSPDEHLLRRIYETPYARFFYPQLSALHGVDAATRE